MSLGRELGRKAFHFLCLVYLAFFLWQGRDLTLWVLGGWIAVVLAVETARLRHAGLNAFLLAFFRGIHREAEEKRMSGIVWTSTGCWLTIALFGAEPRLVTGALSYLAFGDAAAALVGKTLGRRVIEVRGRRRTLEGTLACFAACAASGLALGFPAVPALAAALAATAVEFAAPPPDDNFWLPLVTALTLGVSS